MSTEKKGSAKMLSLFEIMECRHCSKSTRFGEVMLLHLIFKEKSKLTKRDIICLIKHFALFQIIILVFALIYCLLALIVYPFWRLGEDIFHF